MKINPLNLKSNICEKNNSQNKHFYFFCCFKYARNGNVVIAEGKNITHIFNYIQPSKTNNVDANLENLVQV